MCTRETNPFGASPLAPVLEDKCETHALGEASSSQRARSLPSCCLGVDRSHTPGHVLLASPLQAGVLTVNDLLGTFTDEFSGELATSGASKGELDKLRTAVKVFYIFGGFYIYFYLEIICSIDTPCALCATAATVAPIGGFEEQAGAKRSRGCGAGG